MKMEYLLPSIEERHTIYDAFLREFPLERLKKMSLDEYSNLDKNSFCYWLEFKTRSVGGIGGGASFKFGIYRKRNSAREGFKTKAFKEDAKYAWYERYGNSPLEAFEKIRAMVVFVAECAISGELEKIEDVDLWPVFKWKIAFMYSSKKLINWFRQNHLVEISKRMGLQEADSKTICELQRFLVSKRGERDVFQYDDEVLTPLCVESRRGNDLEQEDELEFEKYMENRTAWLIAPGDDACLWERFYREGIIGVGWDGIKDLENYPTESFDSFRKKIDQDANDAYGFSTKPLSRALWGFFSEMKPGDIVYAKKGRSKIIGRGIVTSEYFFSGDYDGCDSGGCYYRHHRKVNWTHTDTWESPGRFDLPIATVTKKEINSDVVQALERFYGAILGKEYEELLLAKKYSEILELLSTKKQIILQGAPGMGKTYTATEVAVALCESNFSGDHSACMSKFRALENLGRIAFTTFHQSVDYEEFVEGIRINSKDGEIKVEDGIFKEMALRAMGDLGHNFVLVIDEINRGNVSKILGELITLLEADKRGENGIFVKLPYSRLNFSVPPNLYIIGTMNTADRSLGVLDYAVRRRFAFYTLLADESLIESDGGRRLFGVVRNFISENISDEFDADSLMIGVSYFMGKEMEQLERTWRYETSPLLKEYLDDGIIQGVSRESIDALWDEAFSG